MRCFSEKEIENVGMIILFTLVGTTIGYEAGKGSAGQIIMGSFSGFTLGFLIAHFRSRPREDIQQELSEKLEELMPI